MQKRAHDSSRPLLRGEAVRLMPPARFHKCLCRRDRGAANDPHFLSGEALPLRALCRITPRLHRPAAD